MMTRQCKILTAICAILSFGPAHAQDSIPAQLLGEVSVTGDRGWVEDGVLNVIPTKKEKRLSNSPASLIKSMHLPFLREKEGAIVGMSGDKVEIYINGEKADEIDLATFWPKEVKRVQYMENPSDPKFGGAGSAVNFIMAKYEAGGVSRASIFQRVPNNGYYTASSKLVYKRMTYGLLLSGDYLRDHRSSADDETTYRGIFYDGVPYESLISTGHSRPVTREQGLRCALNAKYSTDKTTMTHTVSLGWRQNPGSLSSGSEAWTPEMFGGSGSSSRTESRSLSPQASGTYYFRLGAKWHLSGSWRYSYARNKASATSRLGLTEPVSNGTDEDVHSLGFALLPTFMLSERWQLQLLAAGSLDWFSTVYRGSANTQQSQNRQDLSAAFKIYYSPSQSLSLSLEPGVLASVYRIGDIHRHTAEPTVNTGVNWTPGRRFSLNCSLRFYMSPASASESNPVLVKSSELMWTLGNPYLKNLTSWDTYLYSTYLPKSWLSLSLGFGYVRTVNEATNIYTAAPAEMGGLVKETVNASPADNMRANIELRGSFLGDRLSIGVGPLWHHTRARGACAGSLHQISLSGSVDYTFGDFRAELQYDGPYKDLSASGMERSWQEDKWTASLVYGDGSFYLDLRVEDLLNSRRRSWVRYDSKHYSTRHDLFENGRSVSINLSYTLGYGRKVDRGIDISGPSDAKTSVQSLSN